jgi:hypothetical protein
MDNIIIYKFYFFREFKMKKIILISIVFVLLLSGNGVYSSELQDTYVDYISKMNVEGWRKFWKIENDIRYLQHTVKRGSLYLNHYEIMDFDKLKNNKNIEGIYIWYSVSQDTNDFPVDFFQKDNLAKLKYIYSEWEDIQGVQFREITEESFTIKASDLVEGYEWKNTFFNIKVYVKVWESYYSNNIIDYWYFSLSPEWKVYAAVSELDYHSLVNYKENIENILWKIEKKLWLEEYKIFQWKLRKLLTEKIDYENKQIRDKVLSLKSQEEYDNIKWFLEEKSLKIRKMEIILWKKDVIIDILWKVEKLMDDINNKNRK